MKKNFLYEFFGLSKKSVILGDKTFELGKIYSNPYAKAFSSQNEGSGIGTSFVYEDDDTEEYDVEDEDMEDFIAFLKTKVKEKEAYTESVIEEAEYQGRTVKLGKPTTGDVKKFKVYVKNPAGKVVKVNFGHGGTSAAAKGEKTMRIRKSNPKARKSFRARHNCDNPGPRTKARYWSCRKW
jgi:hypothetical protein